jgi:sarcosine oxidase subunit gamma
MVDPQRRVPAVSPAPWCNPLPPSTRFAFYGDAAARAAVQAVWGVGFSEEACRAKTQSARATLWVGPDEYLLLELGGGEPLAAQTAGVETLGAQHPGSEAGQSRADETRADHPSAVASASAIFDRLEGAMAGVPHALVDISHRQFAFEVIGPHAATILSGACPLDLDLAHFPVGMCTRTVLAKADLLLWRTDAGTFHVEVWRSFAGYVMGILSEIAAEFG